MNDNDNYKQTFETTLLSKIPPASLLSISGTDDKFRCGKTAPDPVFDWAS